MRLSKAALTLIVAAAVATPALRASAAANGRDTGPYITLDGGVNIMQDITVEGINGVKIKPRLSNGKFGSGVPSIKQPMDTGFRVGVIGGYNLNKWVAVEIESGFMYNGLTGSDNGWYGSIPLLGNVVLRYENDSKFVPYIGAGAGGAYTMLEGSGTDETYFVFAYQAKVGVAYNINDNMSVDVGYKFFGTGDLEYKSALKLKDIYAHYIGLSFTWKF
jgi:opacity protein-like surface antigen